MKLDNKRLKRRIKYIYGLLKSELENNDKSIQWLKELRDEEFEKIYDYIDKNNNEELTKELLSKSEIDKSHITYYNEISYNNDKQILFRNFLLLLFFMRSFHLDTTNNFSKKTTKFEDFILATIKDENPKNSDTPMKQYKRLFLKGTSNTGIFKKFLEYSFMNINDIFSENISLEIDTLILSNTDGIEEELAEKEYEKFIRSWIDLLTEHNETIIDLFLETLQSEYSAYNIPSTVGTFLRYYIYNDKYNKRNPIRNNTESVYISGVGTSKLVSSLVNDSNDKSLTGFRRELTIGTNDSNIISRQIRLLRHRIITDKPEMFSNISAHDLLTESDLKYDVSIVIPPKELNSLETNLLIIEDKVFETCKHTIEKYIDYNPLPKKNLSCFIHFYNTMKLSKNKSFMIVPLSFISINNYSKNLLETKLCENGRNKIVESQITVDRQKEIVDTQLIKRIMLFPSGVFYHTQEQCILLEITSTKNDGIHFIDGTSFTKELHNELYLDNSPSLKNTFESDEEVYYKDKKQKTLVSKLVSYDDIQNIHSYNILPSYHIQNTFNSSGEPLEDCFNISKSQKLKLVSGLKNDEIEISFFSKSDFSSFGISTSKNTTKKRTIIKDINKFNPTSRVLKNDILIFSNYKNRTDITYIDINTKELCYANHNLIIIRGKDEAKSKRLFLWLMSYIGHQHLLSLVKINNENKPVLSIDDLKKIVVNLENIDVSKFMKIKNKIKSIEKSIVSLNNMY